MSKKIMRLWVDNRLDNQIEKSFDEIKSEFMDSEYYERYLSDDVSYIRDMLLQFLTMKDGLHASFDNDDFEELYDYIRVATRGIL
ncbi:MAG: hypothetical protein GQ474_00545 [Sulfurimonas sp.]|nr:hypothetical protein [Sulfurimonas sp.]